MSNDQINNCDSRPIGVFDSGVGGLSVLSTLIEHFPKENFVYLGDTARLPYGSKSPSTIKKYVTQNINYLIKHQKIKAVVIACNSASTVLEDINIDVDKSIGIPIFGVIKPGAKSALKSSKNNSIAIWSTRATAKQGNYKKELLKLNPEVRCLSTSCPLIVPLVEEGFWEGPITDAILNSYIEPLKQSDADTLILGCTHYTFIKNALKKVLQQNGMGHLVIVDSTQELCKDIEVAFSSHHVDPGSNKEQLSVLLTDEASHFMDLVLKTFPDWKNINFQLIDLQQIV